MRRLAGAWDTSAAELSQRQAGCRAPAVPRWSRRRRKLTRHGVRPTPLAASPLTWTATRSPDCSSGPSWPS